MYIMGVCREHAGCSDIWDEALCMFIPDVDSQI